MQYGCIGERLEHSFSKEIHAHLADYSYELCEIPRGELDAFMRTRDFLAINLTIRYKQDVIPYLDEISPEARAIGAVNTIVNQNGRLLGYNTDFYGILAAMRRLGFPSLAGKKVLILGTGGTSRTAYEVARHLGAATVLKVSRTPSDGAVSYDEAEVCHTDADVIFNTTPVGMYPHTDACPIRLSAFSRLSAVFDAVYNPLRTQLVSEAAARGIPAGGGLYMLVAQAHAAAGIFLGKPLSEELLESTYRQMLVSKENVVLIGMPASGKTTVGRALAAALSRELLDLDTELERRSGRRIPDIFAEDGEEVFRRLESETVAAVAGRTGLVIATGGGVILREESIRRLKQNGRLVFLDRPLHALMPTPDRPTASSAEAIASRYRERYDKYLAAADIHLKGDFTVSQAVVDIIQEFCK